MMKLDWLFNWFAQHKEDSQEHKEMYALIRDYVLEHVFYIMQSEVWLGVTIDDKDNLDVGAAFDSYNDDKTLHFYDNYLDKKVSEVDIVEFATQLRDHGEWKEENKHDDNNWLFNEDVWNKFLFEGLY